MWHSISPFIWQVKGQDWLPLCFFMLSPQIDDLAADWYNELWWISYCFINIHHIATYNYLLHFFQLF
jgi:hypothetical protein